MFQKQTLAFEDTKLLNALVQDYLLKKKETEQLYSFYPDKEGYKKLLQDPKLFSGIDRNTLVACLTKQAKTVANTSQQSLASIEKLNDASCFTVTTGHQLCLFTCTSYFFEER